MTSSKLLEELVHVIGPYVDRDEEITDAEELVRGLCRDARRILEQGGLVAAGAMERGGDAVVLRP